MEDNHGVIDIGRRPRDFVGSDLPFEIRLKDGNWEPYLPEGEHQSFGAFDTMGCVSFSLINCIETQEKFLTGKQVNYSDRWLAMMSGTTPQGNALVIVADTVRKYGLVREESWPTPPNPNWSTYYAVPSAQKMAELKAEGQAWLKTHQFDYAWVGTTQAEMLKQLQHTPLQVVKPGHAIASYLLVKSTDIDKYFDTYNPFKKTIQRSGLTDVLKPLLTLKSMNQTKVALSKDGHTIYKCVPIATTWEDFVKQCGVEGIDIPTPIPPTSSL